MLFTGYGFWILAGIIWGILFFFYLFLFYNLIKRSHLLGTWTPAIGNITDLYDEEKTTEEGNIQHSYFYDIVYHGHQVIKKITIKKQYQYFQENKCMVVYYDPLHIENFKFGRDIVIAKNVKDLLLIFFGVAILVPVAMAIPPVGPLFYTFVFTIGQFPFVDLLIYALIFLSPNILLDLVFVITLALSPCYRGINLNQISS